eukprot:1607477-Prymnesium_polylepis.2
MRASRAGQLAEGQRCAIRVSWTATQLFWYGFIDAVDGSPLAPGNRRPSLHGRRALLPWLLRVVTLGDSRNSKAFEP